MTFTPTGASFVNWDTKGATWDSGLTWDADDVQIYLNLVTSEYNQQPNFMAMIEGVVEPIASNTRLLSNMVSLFDLDTAVGDQLDKIGQWVGLSRNVAVPLTGVFFSWNTANLGWDQGNWRDPNGGSSLVSLPDANYRTLLRAGIASNQWDGTIPGAYDAWNTMFAGTGTGILIQDYQDMSVTFALTGTIPSAVDLALFTGGYLNLKSAGVRIRYYLTPFSPGVPYFAWGVSNVNLAGWAQGYWGNQTVGA